MYANVIVDISHEKLDRIFQYRIPENLQDVISEGVVVKVPFGRGNKVINAFVIELTKEVDYDISKIKDIIDVDDKKSSVESKMIKLAAFIRKNFGGTMNQALKTVVPVKEEVNHKEKKRVRLLLDFEEASALIEQCKKKNAKAKIRLLEALIESNEIPYEKITNEYKISHMTIKALEEAKVIAIEKEVIYRGEYVCATKEAQSHILNDAQQEIADAIKEDYMAGKRKIYLIHGITGSGKTEVYLNVIDSVLAQGKQVIMLIPEIALTYQTVTRFQKRFGTNVAVINSRMSKGEKYDQLVRAKNGEISIVIGPRSALFTPFENVGLIVIDEEHENAYKSESVPKYHAREVAIEMARLNNASVILGSATPSLESYYKAQKGEYTLFELSRRAKLNSSLPKVYIEDMREELRRGNRTMFSDRLKALMDDRMKKREQIMLFINRRGYANFVSCRSCGEAVKCSHCDVSLKLHNNNTLVCHYCGYRVEVPKLCPKCKSKYIAGFGVGTQKVEDEVKKIYPQAKVLRMDFDTTSKKDDYERILSAFSRHEADVLIGTQMIVKGHDFANVTLVGIVAADLSLYTNDYHAGERTFALITQAAGRAGRADLPGEVVIQTYSPENYSIKTAANQDYKSFYTDEIAYRELLEYPPVSNMLVVKLASENMEKCEKQADDMAEFLRKNVGDNTQIVGPVNASVYKVSDIFTNLVYIKARDYIVLTGMKEKIEGHIKENPGYRYVTVQFDFNPMNI